jgi:hypothetical protein
LVTLRRLGLLDGLADGDTLYEFDRSTGRILRETRVWGLVRRPVDTMKDVEIHLAGYGLLIEEIDQSDWLDRVLDCGRLLSYHPQLIAECDLTVPAHVLSSVKGRSHYGFLPFDRLPDDVQGWLATNLPPKGRPAIEPPHATLAPHRIGGSRQRPAQSRYIPVSVRRDGTHPAGSPVGSPVRADAPVTSVPFRPTIHQR